MYYTYAIYTLYITAKKELRPSRAMPATAAGEQHRLQARVGELEACYTYIYDKREGCIYIYTYIYNI